MGFCFGGLCSLDLARADAEVRGVVSLHGLLTPSGLTEPKLRAKIPRSRKVCQHAAFHFEIARGWLKDADSTIGRAKTWERPRHFVGCQRFSLQAV